MSRARRRPPRDTSSAVGHDVAALDLSTVAARLVARRAPTRPAEADDLARWQAATALVLSPGPGGLAAAFIERAVRDGDRWSGQMALPGGRREPGDHDLADTAARETSEEVGLTLGAPLGRLVDHPGRRPGDLVATYVFALEDRPTLVPQPTEVAAADWIDLAWLFDPTHAVHQRWLGMRFPGIAHRDRIIWGLTHRMLDDFAAAVGLELPAP